MGRLTALKVARATKRGLYSDGHGLCLQVTNANAKSWIYRYTINGRTRSLGLGSASAITLKRARELVQEPRRLRAEGIDPLDHRQRNTARPVVTFKEAAEGFIETHRHAWRGARHEKQWRATLAADAYPRIGNMPVDAIDTAAVLGILQPIWAVKPESANRLRGRIETILNAAKAAGLRPDLPNPAAWKGHLQNLLPLPRKLRKVEHFAALDYREIPAFMMQLRKHPSISARALEFLILVAGRTGEVVNGKWSEVDLANATWTIGAARMKAHREHRIPLTGRALTILHELKALDAGEFLFAGNKPDQPLSSSAMLKFLKLIGVNATVHGMRAAFKTWATEATNFPHEVIETSLAHTVGTETERAYARGDLFAKRQRLMQAWSQYCEKAPVAGAVVSIRG
jgi:integrase